MRPTNPPIWRTSQPASLARAPASATRRQRIVAAVPSRERRSATLQWKDRVERRSRQGSGLVGRADLEPRAARAARSLQALGARLVLVAAQPAVHDGHLHHRVQPDPARRRRLRATRAGSTCSACTCCAACSWNFFSISVTTSMATLLGNGSLIKKVYFPREALVLGVTVSGLVTFGIELALLMRRADVLRQLRRSRGCPCSLLLVALLAVFTTGVALVMSSLNVFFRDLSHLWALIAQAWFFLTPIVYPLDIVPAGSAAVHRGQPDDGLRRAVPRRALQPALPGVGPVRRCSRSSRSPRSPSAGGCSPRLSPRFAEEL